MRKLMFLMLATLALAGCSSDDSYGRDHRDYRGDNGYYGGGNGYYGNGYGNGYGSYYPYGNAYYPRDRIWIVDGYNGCRYYSYQGYCYRYKDDLERAILWDRQHGYDDGWHQRRKDWCRTHDCHHDDIVRDAQGRPVSRPPAPESDGQEDRRSPRQQPQAYPAYPEHHNRPYPVDHYGRDADDSRGGQQPVNRQQPVVRSSRPVQQQDSGNVRPLPVYHGRGDEARPQQPVPRVYTQPSSLPRGETVQRSSSPATNGGSVSGRGNSVDSSGTQQSQHRSQRGGTVPVSPDGQ